MVAIHTKYMTRNDCYIANRQITVTKLMLHSTATKGVMASQWFSRWNKSYIKGETNRQVCVHGFVDDKEVWQYLPWNHRAWHAGGSANNFAIGIEMCEDLLHTKEFADKTIRNAAELFAFLCKEFNLDPMKDIISHKEGHKLRVASNHGDPDHWIGKFGYTMDTFRKMVYDIMNPVVEVEKPDVMYRVIIDGKQIMALSTLNSAKSKLTAETQDGSFGIVQRTDGVTMFELDRRKVEEPVVVMYRVIIDGKQIMALSTLESAKAQLKKDTKDGSLGVVQRTDGVNVFEIDLRKKDEPVKVMYRVIIDGKQIMALSTFESAKATVVEKTPNGIVGIVERSTDGVKMFEHFVKPKATWELHLNGQIVKDLQSAVNKYFGAKRLVVDGFYGDATYNGVPNGIRKGMVGYQIIKEIQKRLKTLGFYKDRVDGSFGLNTERAVMAFQKARGFKASEQDGIVGRFTFSELYRK